MEMLAHRWRRFHTTNQSKAAQTAWSDDHPGNTVVQLLMCCQFARQTPSTPAAFDLCNPSQALNTLEHLHAATQKLVHLLVSQACLQTHAAPPLSNPPWAGKATLGPQAKGELLMAVVMAMAQPSQHTQGPATLLNTLLITYSLAAAAQSAIAKV